MLRAEGAKGGIVGGFREKASGGKAKGKGLRAGGGKDKVSASKTM